MYVYIDVYITQHVFSTCCLPQRPDVYVCIYVFIGIYIYIYIYIYVDRRVSIYVFT